MVSQRWVNSMMKEYLDENLIVKKWNGDQSQIISPWTDSSPYFNRLRPDIFKNNTDIDFSDNEIAKATNTFAFDSVVYANSLRSMKETFWQKESKSTMELYDYQSKILSKIIEHDKYILGLEAGGGKTYIALKWLEKKLLRGNSVFIVAKKSKLEFWRKHAKEVFIHYNDSFFQVLDGTTNENYERMRSDCINFIGYDAFRNLNLSNLDIDILIFDESQKINNHKGKLNNKIYKLNIPKMLFLTGTFHNIGGPDLYGVIKLLTPMTYQQFEDKYLKVKKIKTGGLVLIRIVGLKNQMELINFYIQLGYFSRALINPRKVNQTKLIISQTNSYKKLLSDRYIDDHVPANNAVLFQYLRMMATGFIGETTYNDYKIGALKQFTKKDIIIFYNWNHELKAIKNFIGSTVGLVYYEINGNENELDDFIKNSQEHKNISHWCLIQYQSGGDSIDGLQLVTNTAVFYSLPLGGGMFEQAQKRINRINQEAKEVNYYYIMMTNTIEGKIFEVLLKRKKFTKAIFESYLKNNGD